MCARDQCLYTTLIHRAGGQVRDHGARVASLPGAAGTLVIFEISNVHRGAPCVAGERASLTNYYRVRKPSTACAAPSRAVREDGRARERLHLRSPAAAAGGARDERLHTDET